MQIGPEHDLGWNCQDAFLWLPSVTAGGGGESHYDSIAVVVLLGSVYMES